MVCFQKWTIIVNIHLFLSNSSKKVVIYLFFWLDSPLERQNDSKSIRKWKFWMVTIRSRIQNLDELLPVSRIWHPIPNGISSEWSFINIQMISNTILKWMTLNIQIWMKVTAINRIGNWMTLFINIQIKSDTILKWMTLNIQIWMKVTAVNRIGNWMTLIGTTYNKLQQITYSTLKGKILQKSLGSVFHKLIAKFLGSN